MVSYINLKTKLIYSHSSKSVLENMTEMCFCPWLKYVPIQWLTGRYKKFEKAKKQIRQFTNDVGSEEYIPKIKP